MKKGVVHAISWIAFASLVFYWQTNLFELPGALMHTTRIIIFTSLLFYLNLHFLLPKLFDKGKLVPYVITLVVLMVITHHIFGLTNDLMPPPEKFFREQELIKAFKEGKFEQAWKKRPKGASVIFTAMNTIPSLFISTIIWFSELARRRRQQESDLKSESLQSEMKFLKSQINPHFLFNALNNIYSLSITKSQKAPEMIMKLSEMLRHVVYDSSNKTTLEKEIQYINNFIEFQNLKIGTKVDVKFECDANGSEIIEPMVLIPFVENAFKHGDIENNPNGFVHIQLLTKRKYLHYSVINTYPKTKESKDKYGGVGIQNVKKRLEVAYPGKANLHSEAKEGIFSVELDMHLT